MKTSVCLVVLPLLICAATVARGESVAVTKLIENLSSKESSVVDSSLKLLGFQQGISGGFEKCQMVRPRVSDANSLYVLALSWNPYDGYLLLMDSSGQELTRKRIGYIKSIGLRQLRESGDDAIVTDSIFGTGTGIEEDRFYILTIAGKQLSEVWKGLSYKHEYPLAVAPKNNIKISGCIRFSKSTSNNSFDLIHTLYETRFSYDTETGTLSEIGTKERTNTFILRDDKYVPLERAQGAAINNLQE